MGRSYRRIQSQNVEPTARTANLEECRAELRHQFRLAIHAPPNTVTLIQPLPGFGKTFIATEEIAGITDVDMKFLVLVQTQALAAAEWEDRIPGSLRLMSLEKISDEGRLIDGNEQIVECPFLKEIKTFQARGLPYYSYYCAQRCDLRGNCSYHRTKNAAETARVVVAQHAHLSALSRTGIADDRIVIIDECAAIHMRTRIEFTPDKLSSFRNLLDEFQSTGEADENVLRAIRRVLNDIESVAVGASKLMNDPGSVIQRGNQFRAKFNNFLSDGAAKGWNLLSEVVDMAITRRFVRCSKVNDATVWWSVRSNLPSNGKPVVILDATGSRELYQELFPGRNVVVWPEEGQRFTPKSDVTVFCDGVYPQASLWDTTTEPPKPSKCFDEILEHVSKIIEFHKADASNIGFVSLLKLVEPIAKKFPLVRRQNVLHYGDLRGRNELKDCEMVFIIGCQPPSLNAVADAAATMFSLDCDPSSLIGDVELQREYATIGGKFEVKQFAFGSKWMRLAWEALVIAEVAQAVGRARAYADREIIQQVFVFTNLDIGMPATRIMTRNEHLASMGFAVTKADKLYLAIKNLAAEGKEFGFKEISLRSGIEIKDMKSPSHQAAIKKAISETGTTVSGRPKRFESPEQKEPTI